MQVKIDIKKVVQGLDAKKEVAEKAVKRTVNEIRSKANGWISDEVRKEYAIAKKDIKAALHIESNGSMKIKGVEVKAWTLLYKGRLLTPTHFGMKLAKRTKRMNPISAEVKKGARKVLSSKAFLAHSGGAGSKEIPFQRKGRGRVPIEAIKTISVPQMIESREGLKPGIERAISEGIEERFKHNCDYLLSRQ